MAILFVDGDICSELVRSIRFSRDLYTKPSNILLAHPNGVDYIALKNRLYFNIEKKISPSNISEYKTLDCSWIEKKFYDVDGYSRFSEWTSVLHGVNIIISENFLNPNGKKILKEMLNMSNYKVGDKVVLVGNGIYLEKEKTKAWKESQRIGQPFVYVYEVKGNILHVSEKLEDDDCSEFYAKDVVPYQHEVTVGDFDKYIKLTVENVFKLVDAGILKKEDLIAIFKL